VQHPSIFAFEGEFRHLVVTHWVRVIVALGFDVYEKLAQKKSAGKYFVVSLADVVLAPAVERVLMRGVDFTK
jgi:hypothetical protein